MAKSGADLCAAGGHRASTTKLNEAWVLSGCQRAYDSWTGRAVKRSQKKHAEGTSVYFR